MSAYPPPTRNQTIFNPSNFSGGLGDDGSITIDYLNSNYLKFPVAQANNTLAGTTILGNISHTGNMVSNGSIQGASFTANGIDLITEIGTKQDEINTGDLAITDVAELETTLQGKQPTINDGDLTLERTDGLVSALAGKQPTINDGDLTLERTDGLVSALAGKQPTINDGDLTLERTDGLVSALAGKQPTIDAITDLTSNSITTNDLVVNNNLNIDDVLTYNSKTFNTLVIRRFNLSTEIINLNELQVWVNDANIMFSNASILNGYFANWSNKDVPINPFRFGTGLPTGDVSRMYDNQIQTDYEAHSQAGSGTNAMIIKDIPQTIINNIQAIVLYNRPNADRDKAIGLIIELYNNVDDPTLSVPLATTNIISLGVNTYRFNFPAINTYPTGSFSSGNSTSKIASDTFATTEDANVNITDAEINMNANVITTGDISCNSITTNDLVVGTTNIINEIGTKQATINDGDLTIAKINGLQTALDNKYDDTGGTISGSATITGSLTCDTISTIGNATIGGNLTITGGLTNSNQPAFRIVSAVSGSIPAGNPIKYNNPIMDIEGGYSTTTGEYTIPIAGNWYFYYSFQSNGDDFKVQLQQNGNIRDQVGTDTTPTINTDLGCKGMTLIPCSVGDIIRVFVFSGSVRVENADEFHSFGGFLIG